jgi:sulfite reductase beta subunit-like hemoprotein
MFNSEFEALEKFARKYALGFERGEGSSHFLRIKVVGTELNTNQARVIAELSRKYGKGYLEITVRHDIQLHWVKDEDAPEIFSKLEELGLHTDMCGQAYPEAGHGDVRNIVTCPLSGVQEGELIDTIPIVKEAVNFFTGKEEYLDLPKKFKIAISSCPLNCVRLDINDVGLKAIKAEHGIGFTVFVGGGIGVPAILAKPMDIFVPPEDVLSFLKAIVEVYRDHGNRESKAKARFKWLIQTFGVKRIREMVEERIGRKLKDFDASKINLGWKDHIGYNPQRGDGLFSLTVPIQAGMLNSEQLLKIADIADRYCDGKLRFSTSQNIVLVNIPKENLAYVRRGVEWLGFPLDPLPIKWTTIACPTNFCGKGADNVKKRSVEVVEHLEKVFGEKLKDLHIRIAFSGCPNSCSQYIIADIGLLSTQVRKDDRIEAAYNIYLGGRSPVSRLFIRDVSAEEVRFVAEDIIGKYLDAKHRFSNFREFAETLLEKQAVS